MKEKKINIFVYII